MVEFWEPQLFSGICSHPFSLASSRCDRLNPGYYASRGADLEKKESAPALVGDEGRCWRGPPTAARATSGAGEGAEDETNNSKFAKRTWNVPWNQQLHFLASHFTVADREARPAWSLPEGKPRGAGGIAADVDGKGVKRTSQAIVLKVNEISAFGANEMHGVKVFVM